jgi:malate/lactate dehydrogenase
MSISVSIIGASGAVGTTLASHILRSDLLGAYDRLQLVGRGVSASTEKLLATAEAYEIARRAPPDARILVEPMITGLTRHSTPNATANATLHCLTAAIMNDHRRTHGQVLLHGEFLNLHGVCGVPLNVNRGGWQVAQLDTLTADEEVQIRRAARSIDCYLTSVYSDRLDEVQ